MKIPTEFSLFGHTVKVQWLDKLETNEGCTGEARYNHGLINIQKNNDGFERNSDMIEVTFWHELVHWIFFVCGEHELRNNEKLVDLMARALHEFDKTKR